MLAILLLLFTTDSVDPTFAATSSPRPHPVHSTRYDPHPMASPQPIVIAPKIVHKMGFILTRKKSVLTVTFYSPVAGEYLDASMGFYLHVRAFPTSSFKPKTVTEKEWPARAQSMSFNLLGDIKQANGSAMFYVCNKAKQCRKTRAQFELETY